jgi:hypothetical protein
LGNYIDEQLVLKYINEAIGIENEGLTIETGKKETAIPDFCGSNWIKIEL